MTATSAQAEDDVVAAFLTAFRHHAGGVSVVTTDSGTGPVAATLTSVVSVSAAPPTIVFSASGRSSSTPALRAAQSVVVHLLAVGDLAIARLGATSGVDRFADPSHWARDDRGGPHYLTSGPRLHCDVLQRVPVEDSTLVVARVRSVHPGSAAERPLVYCNRTWHALGGDSILPDPTTTEERPWRT